MKKIVLIFIFLLYLSIGNSFAAKWTILVYMDADNNLEQFGIADFKEMAKSKDSDDVNVVVQMDRTPGEDSSYGDWTTGKRFLIKKVEDPNNPGKMIDMTPTEENQIEDIGEPNMGKATTLLDFLKWGVETYPAENYFVVCWDHGGGWEKRGNNATKGFCWDDSNGSDYIGLTNGELISVAEAFYDLTGKKCMWGFDACLMQMMETSYELKDYVSVLVASEETEPGDGWTYDVWLGKLKSNSSMTALNIGKAVVDSYSGSTLSVINLSKATNLGQKLTALANEMLKVDCLNNAEIKASANSAKKFGAYAPCVSKDLYMFVDALTGTSLPSELIAAAEDVKTAIGSTVYAYKNDGGYDDCRGIAIQLGKITGTYQTEYNGLVLAQYTKWDEFLKGVDDPGYEPIGTVFESSSNIINIGNSIDINEVNIYVNVLDPDVSDLTIEVSSPSSATVKLWDNQPNNNKPNIDAWFDEEYPSAEPLDAFVNENSTGIWSIRVSDASGQASLISWKIEIR
jgi:hypothetical protein